MYEEEMNSPDFWNNQERSSYVIQELNELKSIVKGISSLDENVNELTNLISTDVDFDTKDLIESEYFDLEKNLDKLELYFLLDGEYDKNNCILEIHSGAGGTEACDWAMMIYRMYLRWCDLRNYKYEIIDYQEGEEVGIKSVSLLVKGLYAYGYLNVKKVFIDLLDFLLLMQIIRGILLLLLFLQLL